MKRMLQADRLERSQIARILREVGHSPDEYGLRQGWGLQLPKMTQGFPELNAKDTLSEPLMSDSSNTRPKYYEL